MRHADVNPFAVPDLPSARPAEALDVLRGRSFEPGQRFLPVGLARTDELEFLRADEQRLLSQIQGWTYVRLMGLLGRAVSTRVADIRRQRAGADERALAAVMRFIDDERRQQALLQRVGDLIGAGLPQGQEFVPEHDGVSVAVMAAPRWVVFALNVQLDTLAKVHCPTGLEPDAGAPVLCRELLMSRWTQACRRVVADAVEWERENALLAPAQRAQAVDDLLGLAKVLDGALQAQAGEDASYFLRICGRALSGDDTRRLGRALLAAYRWQYLIAALNDAHFSAMFDATASPEQRQRLLSVLDPPA